MSMVILFGLFFSFLIFGVPIAFGLGLSSIITLLVLDGFSLQSLTAVGQRMFNGINSFPLMAIPLFLLAGNLMTQAKISDKLLDFASLFMGRVKGGMVYTSTMAAAFFGTISGSSPATTAAIGSIMIPSMDKKGYDKGLSASVVASSGLIGLIIPPSITLVLYGVTAGVSIGALFLAGVVPGIIMAVLAMCVNYFVMKRYDIPSHTSARSQPIFKVILNSLLALLMPVIILGGIYSGQFTPTESAAVACLYAFIVGTFIYRTVSIKDLISVFRKTAESSAMVMFLLASAFIFSHVITIERIPQQISDLVLGFTENPIMIMFIFLALFLLLGTFLDNSAAIVMVVPTTTVVIQQVGIDPIFFGIFMIIALAIGQITPPIGTNLFVAADIASIKFESLITKVIPYITVYILFLILSIFVPDILTLFT